MAPAFLRVERFLRSSRAGGTVVLWSVGVWKPGICEYSGIFTVHGRILEEFWRGNERKIKALGIYEFCAGKYLGKREISQKMSSILL